MMLLPPNSSTPISVQASGVLVAPAKTAIKPRPANKSTGAPLMPASTLPRVAPIKNRGVTSPPLKPVLNVMAVKSSFQNQLQLVAPPDVNAERILTPPRGLLTPRPR